MIFGLAAQWKEKRYTLNRQEGMEILFFALFILKLSALKLSYQLLLEYMSCFKEKWIVFTMSACEWN